MESPDSVSTNEIHRVGLGIAHALRGVSVTYTEAGAAGQAATALAIDFKRSSTNVTKVFEFLDNAVTVDSEAWRGATITDDDSKVYTVTDREDAPGLLRLTGVRSLERN